MSYKEPLDRARPSGAILSAGELSARRVAWRRRRTRNRFGLFAGLAVALALAFIASRGGSGQHPAPAPARAAAPAGKPPPPARVPRVVAHRAVSQRRSVNRVLAYTPYVQFAHGKRRVVALTFDDGPGPFTGSILRILKRTHTPATFFVIGRSARLYPKLVADEARDGFEIGDHTETHAFLTQLSPAGQVAEISEAAQDIHRDGAPAPVLFRPPYGAFDPETLAILRARRMLMVLWSADTSDYARPGVAKIAYTAISGGAPGAIILMHDGGGDRSQTVAALPRIIRRLRQRGFHLVTISQLVAADPPSAGQPPPQPLSGIG